MRPPRLSAGCYVGIQRYFLTMCTFRRVHYFACHSVVEAVGCEWLRTCDDYGFEDVAHCFMPDHLHGLVEGLREDADLRKFASMFKQRSSFQHRRLFGVTLWQEGFYDRVLRAEEETPAIIAYMLNNPVRAGLCEVGTAYPHIGSTRYSTQDLAEFVRSSPPWRPHRRA